jgi:metacaspase-1
MFSQGRAILIGVDKYHSHYLPGLPAAVNDVKAIESILTDQNYCGYQSENVKVLIGSHANLVNIRKTFKDINSDEHTTLFIYFSGHVGRIWENNRWQVYLCPQDANPNDLENTALSGEEFLALLNHILAKKIIVILDACHAGGIPIKSTNGFANWKPGLPKSFYEHLSKGNGRVLILSSKEDQPSYIRGKLSLFTTHLVKALQGNAAIRGNGYIHILDVFDYVNDSVSKEEPNQTPILKADNLDSNFPIAFNINIKNQTKSTPAIVLEIREHIILDTRRGAKELSDYLSKQSDHSEKRDEVDLIRSALEKVLQDAELFGWDENSRTAMRRIIFRLLRICTEIGY